MSDDVVAELDRWLAEYPTSSRDTPMQRARDEIVALWDQREAWTHLAHLARSEALEEAARACETRFNSYSEHMEAAELCAAAIRELKN